jgi:nucleoside 2-deoxyribosyltransferase
VKIYIAAKYDDIDGAINAADYLKSFGHQITCEWWYLSGPPTKEIAEKEVQGVIDCDVLIGIFEKDYVYRGAIFEVGLAHGLGKKIFIIGNRLDPMIFSLIPSIIKAKTFPEVFKALKEMQQTVSN